jgi:haloalkane dehalogenase
MKKVLLTTVCSPFGRDTSDCTRHVMPELFHAQVTRSQGIFSLRSTYISYGLEYIAKNISTPAVVLQYPTMDQFEKELKKGYDFVGISFVIATYGKMEKMCRLVRDVSPKSKIVLGGYGTMLPECDFLADHVCREEGVDFMRRLLQESHNAEPKQHVVYSTSAKIAGFPLMKGAVVLAGLGCPHGCEFCSTSHYHKTKHIPLLKTGVDLYHEIKRVQTTLGGRNLPIGIIEEDFLMQKERATEYLDCIKKENVYPARISCFASAYSISQWNPDDLVRMGIEVIWIGVESGQANYSKLKGLNIPGIFESLHSRGINTLASLIIGHDFHTEANIWKDFEYLVSLKPSLSQILILTPACSTPLFDRLKKAGRLLDIPTKYWDGFHLVFKHPSISKTTMEELILEFYAEEYRRLGPSAVRFIEKQLAGYRRFKDSADPCLSRRAEQYRTGCVEALPIFPLAIRNAPTRDVAGRTREIHASIINEFGSGGLKSAVQACVVPVLAQVEKMKQSRGMYSQVKVRRTGYRMSASLLHPVTILADEPLTVQPRLRHAAVHPLVVDLKGAFNKMTARKFKERVHTYLSENKGTLAINFSGVTKTEPEALFHFLKKIKGEKERIKIVSLDSLRADIAEAITYAKRYFEVFVDIERLTASFA